MKTATCLTLSLTCAALFTACQSKDAGTLTGDWQSGPVQLIRPGMDETFKFSIKIDELGLQTSEHIMDVSYHSTDKPSGVRTIRQDLTLIISDNGVTMDGSNPRQTAGSEIIGVYESDSLSCQAPKSRTASQLTCLWGSDAHGNPLSVTLNRVNP